MIETLGIRNANKIVPSSDEMKPVDPVTENMDIMNSKPVKAFFYQDHEAHLQVHMTAMQDPKIRQVVGQNPKAQEIMAAAAAHIMEHVAFQYRKEIEKQLGASLPPMPDGEKDETYLPEAVELEVSRLAAQAAAKLLQKDVAEAQAQQIAQQQQDPVIQMQQMELQLRQQELQLKQQQMQMDAQVRQAELQRKTQEMQIEAAAKADELDLKKTEIQGRQQIEVARLQSDLQKHRTNLSAKQQAEGVRMGIEIGKAKESSQERRMQAQQRQQTQKPPKKEE
jgi:hypothetical protein